MQARLEILWNESRVIGPGMERLRNRDGNNGMTGRARAVSVMVVGLLLTLGTAVAEEYSLACIYSARESADNPTPELEVHERCAEIGEDGRPRIAARHLEAVARTRGLAKMLIDDWYYVRPDGSSLRVITFDNGADSWAEGLVRSVRDRKMVYLNEAFEEVIPPRYDWGWPFENGRALVCRGCRKGDPDGEHTPMVGGSWGYIDRSGIEVVPVRFSRQRARQLLESRGGDD